MIKKVSWKNIFPAICIPLNDDYSINEKELRKFVSSLAEYDEIDGIVVNGHTGEITSFNREERKRITEIVAEEVGDRVMVVTGVCAEGTLEAIDHARDAQEAGADGILLMPPHVWLRFGMDMESVHIHFKKIAEAIDIGIIIHLYPAGTKAFYPVETVVELSKIENVKAIKIGTRQMALYERDVRILREKAPDLSILTCHDESILSSMYVGVDGALIGFGCVIPELISSVWKAVKENDFKKTREIENKIFPMAEAIYGIGQPTAEAHARMKEALFQRGVFSSALMRLPVVPRSEKQKKAVSEALMKSGLLKK